MTTNLRSAVRRLQAVIGALDETLDETQPLLSTPLPRASLSPKQWAVAEATRHELEDDLRVAELAAADASALERDWRSKAALARKQSREELAAMADERADAAAREAAHHTGEINAIRAFLIEYTVRVTPAPTP